MEASGYLVQPMGQRGRWHLRGSANATLGLTNNGTQWTLTFQNGEKRIFSYATGVLSSIIDRNGNTTQLSYDSGGDAPHYSYGRGFAAFEFYLRQLLQ